MKLVLGVVALAAVWNLMAQEPAGAPAFEVASVKRNANPDGPRLFQALPGGRVNLVNQTVRQLIYSAYQTQDYQVIGGPSWLSEDRFDIEAKAPDNAPPSTMLLMVRSLLASRFRLAMHKETREVPIYRMVLRNGKPGAALKPSACMGASPAPTDANGQSTCFNGGGRGQMLAAGVTMNTLANRLGRLPQIGRPVKDETGLAGAFDFELTYSPDLETTDPNAVSILTALQEQLGIRLEAARGPMEVMVIDSVQQPTEN